MGDRRLGRRAVVSASMAVVLGGLGVAGSELLREASIAAGFGTIPSLDAFFGVWIVPALIVSSSVYLGKLAIVPIVTAHVESKGESARSDLSELLGNIFLISLALAVLLIALGPWLVRLILPGLAEDLAQEAEAALKNLSPYLIGGLLSAYFASILQARRQFIAASTTRAIPNIAVVVGVLFFAKVGVGVLAWTLSLGALFQAFVLWLCLGRSRLWLFPVRLRRSPLLRQVGTVIWAPAILLGLKSLALVIDRTCASVLGPGAVSGLNYAHRLAIGAHMLLSGTAFTVSIPFVAALYSRGQDTTAERLLQRAVYVLVFVLAPLVMILTAFGSDVVGVLLMRGQFDEQSAVLTGTTLAVFAWALLPDSASAILSAPYYARAKPRVPLRVLGTIAPLHLLLVRPLSLIWGVPGIALASVVTAFAGAYAMGVRARRDRQSKLFGPQEKRTLQGIAVGSVTILLLGYAMRELPWYPDLSEPLFPRALALCCSGAFLLTTYLIIVSVISRESPSGLLRHLVSRSEPQMDDRFSA
ncbi:MAG: hypothetical protein CME06_14150 [Gemmatimonadetes bacterium]|nr:hypothetical protein [Gemmatimonadota bacterium]